MKNKCLFLLCLLSANTIALANPIHIVTKDEPLKWKAMPHSAGKYTVLAGDPSKPGLFVIRVKFPANYLIYPHYHSHAEYDTVIAGSCYIAYGTQLKKQTGTLTTPGTFVAIPPNLPHYGWTGPQGAVIQLSGMGPWKPIYQRAKA